jgi:hypothetical protein
MSRCCYRGLQKNGGWCAGRRILREDIFVKRCRKRKNIAGCEKRNHEQLSDRRRSRPDACRLADLASGLSLPFTMSMI